MYGIYVRNLLQIGESSPVVKISCGTYPLLLLLFSHQLMATMQSVVAGQAPITLERKYPRRKNKLKTEDNTRNN